MMSTLPIPAPSPIVSMNIAPAFLTERVFSNMQFSIIPFLASFNETAPALSVALRLMNLVLLITAYVMLCSLQQNNAGEYDEGTVVQKDGIGNIGKD